jgi:hypothetical protein
VPGGSVHPKNSKRKVPRVFDLSYTAALRIDCLKVRGSSWSTQPSCLTNHLP